MRIQISPKRIVPDVPTVWNEDGPEVDFIFKDIKSLGFHAGAIEEMYVFHIFEHLFESEIATALENWKSLMAPGAKTFFIADDFEFVSRAFLGGEFDIDAINEKFSYPTKISKDNIIRWLEAVGYSQHDMSFWYVDVPNLFPKKEFEIVVSATKK